MYKVKNTGSVLAVRMRRFLAAEDGAVTVDWVILTSAIVGMCVTILMQYTNSIDAASQNIVTDLGTTMTAAAALN